jgi:hypothetical protein
MNEVSLLRLRDGSYAEPAMNGFRFSIGSRSQGMSEITFTAGPGGCMYQVVLADENGPRQLAGRIRQEKWEALKHTLCTELNLSGWQKDYASRRAEEGVMILNGDHWNVDVLTPQEVLSWQGRENYPENWNRLAALMEPYFELIG